MSLKVLNPFLNIFSLIYISQLFLLIYSENTTTLHFYTYDQNKEILCDTKNNSRVTVKEDQSINIQFESSNKICCIQCSMLINGKLRQILKMDKCVDAQTSEDIKITRSMEGVMKCAVSMSMDKESINSTVKCKGVNYKTAYCNTSVYVDADDKNTTDTWIYIGAGVGVVVTVIIIIQTVAVYYFKNKAKMAVRRSRLQNLSTKTYQEPQNSDKARYSTDPVKSKKSKKKSDEETLYESVEDIMTIDSLRIDHGPTPIGQRPLMPIPNILNDEIQYEDMNYEQSDTLPHNTLNRSMIELTAIPQRPPMPPPTDSLPRKPKMSRHMPPTPYTADNWPRKSPLCLLTPPNNLPPKPGSLKPVFTPHPNIRNNKHGNKPNPTGRAAGQAPHTMLKPTVRAQNKKPQPAPKPQKAVQSKALFSPTSIIPVNYEGPADEERSSDEEWTYEPLKDTKYYL